MSWDDRWGERASVTQARYCELFTEAEELRAKVSDAAATINSLTGEVERLQSLVPHPGDGACEWCGFGPATPVVLCEECRGPAVPAVRS